MDPLGRSGSEPTLRSRTHEVHIAAMTPFLGTPADTGKLMAPHPLSKMRMSTQDFGDWDMKKLRYYRNNCNFVFPKDENPMASSPKASSAGSVFALHGRTRKHTRNDASPASNYLKDKVTSHAVGWYAESGHSLARMERPQHRLTESTVTKTYVNMKETNMESILRLCK